MENAPREETPAPPSRSPAAQRASQVFQELLAALGRWWDQIGGTGPEEIRRLATMIRNAERDISGDGSQAIHTFNEHAGPLIRLIVDFTDEQIDPARVNASMQNDLAALARSAGLETFAPERGDNVSQHRHQVMGRQPCNDVYWRGKIARVLRRGLVRRLDGELIRPAEVEIFD
jgi:hypothetical protein